MIKNEKAKIIILVAFGVIIISLCVVIGYQYGKYNKSSNNTKFNTNSTTTTKENSTTTTKSNDSYAKDIDINKITTKKEDNSIYTNNIKVMGIYESEETYSLPEYKEVGTLMKNDNDIAVWVDVYINYYNDAGTRIGSDSQTFMMVRPHTEFAMEISAHPKEKFSKVDISYKAKKCPSYFIDTSIVTSDLNPIEKKDKIVYSLNNNTNKRITLNVLFKFYKNNKFIYAYNSFAYDDAPNIVGTVYTSQIDYDMYEVLISSAYNTEEKY